jgi:Fibrobacter succinogenes major domain (Fib_succ_major).
MANFLPMSGILLTVILIFPCFGATGLCNGVRYDKDIYRCEYGELIGKCRGKDYYVAYDQCVNGIVVNSTASSNNSGTFTDNRDGKTYKWVKIGKQTWMAENLNYNANGSKCHNNNHANCKKYGRLYNWATAMGIDAKYNYQSWNGSDIKHQGICPKGWHLPTKVEWDVLIAAVGGEKTAGRYLKATSGWNYNKGKSGNGTDAYGFAALPGSCCDGGASGFTGINTIGRCGDWWSASMYDNYEIHDLYMFEADDVRRDKALTTCLLSIRCVKD